MTPLPKSVDFFFVMFFARLSSCAQAMGFCLSLKHWSLFVLKIRLRVTYLTELLERWILRKKKKGARLPQLGMLTRAQHDDNCVASSSEQVMVFLEVPSIAAE